MSTSEFYDWCSRTAAERTAHEITEANLVELIREIFDITEGNYGVPRIHRELRYNERDRRERQTSRLLPPRRSPQTRDKRLG